MLSVKHSLCGGGESADNGGDHYGISRRQGQLHHRHGQQPEPKSCKGLRKGRNAYAGDDPGNVRNRHEESP